MKMNQSKQKKSDLNHIFDRCTKAGVLNVGSSQRWIWTFLRLSIQILNFFGLFYVFNWIKMNVFGCLLMYLYLVIGDPLILDKIRKVWRSKKELRGPPVEKHCTPPLISIVSCFYNSQWIFTFDFNRFSILFQLLAHLFKL